MSQLETKLLQICITAVDGSHKYRLNGLVIAVRAMAKRIVDLDENYEISFRSMFNQTSQSSLYSEWRNDNEKTTRRYSCYCPGSFHGIS